MLYFTIGLPRSGKSTKCNQWVKHELDIYQNQFQPHINEDICPTPHIEGLPRVVVCSDDIRIALTGCRFSSAAEETVHAMQKVMVKSLLNRGFDVIVDGTNTTKSSIVRMFEFHPTAQYIYVNTPVETCLRRSTETQQSDLIPVISRMSDQIQILINQEGNGTIDSAIKNIQGNMKFKANVVVQ